jgi:hypothetical protein
MKKTTKTNLGYLVSKHDNDLNVLSTEVNRLTLLIDEIQLRLKKLEGMQS